MAIAPNGRQRPNGFCFSCRFFQHCERRFVIFKPAMPCRLQYLITVLDFSIGVSAVKAIEEITPFDGAQENDIVTAIYAFVDSTTRTAAMAADNLECASGRLVDKIQVYGDRYVVGFYGNEFPKWAMDAIQYWWQLKHEIAANLADFHDEAEKLIKHFVESNSSILQEKMPSDDWNTLLEQDAAYVVIDIKEHKMEDFTFKTPLVSVGHENVSTRPLRPGVMHHFAQAHELSEHALSEVTPEEKSRASYYTTVAQKKIKKIARCFTPPTPSPLK